MLIELIKCKEFFVQDIANEMFWSQMQVWMRMKRRTQQHFQIIKKNLRCLIANEVNKIY